MAFATRWVDRVACVADDGARHAVAEGVAASKVVTVWNGIDFAPFEPTAELNEAGQALRRQLGILDEDSVLLSLANPRPLSTLLTNLIHTVMADLGNPGYENSAAIRLVLHQLLHLLDRSSLPKYDRETPAYMADIDACEECIGVKAAA